MKLKVKIMQVAKLGAEHICILNVVIGTNRITFVGCIFFGSCLGTGVSKIPCQGLAKEHHCHGGQATGKLQTAARRLLLCMLFRI